MKTKKPSRILSLLLSAVMLLALLPAVSGNAAAAATEQFNLARNGTYYFDLSSEIPNIGTVNTGYAGEGNNKPHPGVPDATLHYVPFTYAGTVNAYSLSNSSSGNPGAATAATPSNRSLFVADYVISYNVSWNKLAGLNEDGTGAMPTENLIFGKTFNTNYKLRSLSGGNREVYDPTNRALPTNNEWDSIWRKSELTDHIKNWSNVYSWGQETAAEDNKGRSMRGLVSATDWNYYYATSTYPYTGFRPALEVLNPTALKSDGLKAVTLNLNGGSFDSNGSVTDGVVNSLNVVCAGDNFKAPSATGLTRPADITGTYFQWNTKVTGDGKNYAVGAPVPNSVKTLYAQWKKPIPEGARYDVVGGTGSGSRLERSLNVEVTDPTAGITAADKANGNKFSLKLTVAEKATVTTPESEQIEGVKQGDIVQYYDVKVEKTVTPPGGDTTTTVLTSIPKPVQAVIPVPAAIQGKTSYTVYRVHNGTADKIPHDPTAPEFYTVNPDGTSLTLHVRKFSTYAVITGGKSLTGDVTFGDANNPKRSDMDVQGKVLEGIRGVYKLDISWGAMKFDYNAQGKVWNPVTHVYDIVPGAAGWTKESFEAGNNKITVANHSNGDVMLYYAAKLEAALAGATMTVRSTNSLQGVLAENLPLVKVPTEGNMTAPTVDAYVWLDGNPASLTSKTYTKAGVITITAEPDMTSGLTPNVP